MSKIKQRLKEFDKDCVCNGISECRICHCKYFFQEGVNLTIDEVLEIVKQFKFFEDNKGFRKTPKMMREELKQKIEELKK